MLNYRVVDGTTSLSKHALGCAIDINPFYNPYVVFDKTGNGQDYISPKGSEIYADRSKDLLIKLTNRICVTGYLRSTALPGVAVGTPARITSTSRKHPK